ncbi:Putative type II secretion system protein K [Zhongshania aliphaticivorans]|uniref:Type II secretion system protein K n=1 Tax=Zhongshania aliphaticivorans TaxID=1470434 RepID=A0A5S9QAN5_9GAMM|nr:type II secretion system minor pseudopilin GspK [Zhongshania aliphaticivorans]CAA0087237.1 Putative type II secretion system protein K [Zhongshania aliphaticivorans]CAA0114366.1 Putative type II secretion system protein K [Zhongshania aliphaticivorans]
MMHKQRGAALMMVLLIVAIMVVLAVGLTDGVRYSSQRLLNQRLMDQGYWYALGGERIAVFGLQDASSEPVTALNQDWARKDIVFPIDGGSIAGLIVDEQACFNLNALYRAEAATGAEEDVTAAELIFTGLLENLEISAQRAEFIIGRTQDWIDSDFSPEGIYGAEDLTYTALDYPYLPPNSLLDSVSEMGLYAEFEEDEQTRIEPYLCALPEVSTTINVNTLAVEQAALLAAAVGNVISMEQAATILESRPDTGWDDVASFVTALELPAEDPLPANILQAIGVKSFYFRGLADVFYEQRQMRLFSRLVVKNGKAIVYAREYGEVF